MRLGQRCESQARPSPPLLAGLHGPHLDFGDERFSGVGRLAVCGRYRAQTFHVKVRNVLFPPGHASAPADTSGARRSG
jgi:hypothetical protein